LAERFVQTFKDALKKNAKNSKTVDLAVAEILFQYRVTPHPATGQAPAEMMMAYPLRTMLHLAKPSRQGTAPSDSIMGSRRNALASSPVIPGAKTIPGSLDDRSVPESSSYRERMKRNHDKKARKDRSFELGDLVFARDYTARRDKWIPGRITEKLGVNTYKVETNFGTWKRSINQLKSRTETGAFSPCEKNGVFSSVSNKQGGADESAKKTVRFNLPEEEEESSLTMLPQRSLVEREPVTTPGNPTVEDYFLPEGGDEVENPPDEQVEPPQQEQEPREEPLAVRRERRVVRRPDNPGYVDSQRIRIPRGQVVYGFDPRTSLRRINSIETQDSCGSPKKQYRSTAYQRRLVNRKQARLQASFSALLADPEALKPIADWSQEFDDDVQP
jgi:hypothetical protein